MSVLVDIEKRLGSFRLAVRFEAEEETLALLGASGCGKSMTLKCIAGVETPDKGRILIDGVTVFDSQKKINLPPQSRRVGLLFQNYALFPNMTVLQNIRTGARREKDKKKREAAAEHFLERFGLKDLADRYPYQLSGGQQQRTALARILVSDPRILLLDEPFSALDTHLRFRLEQEVKDVIRSFGKTVLLVSHDRDEVYRMADSIAVMDQGQVDVCGEKKAVFASPTTRAGAVLTGCKNVSRARPLGENRIRALNWGLDLMTNGSEVSLQEIQYVGIRMHDVRLAGADDQENKVLCKVHEVTENPFSVTIMLRPEQAGEGDLIGWETDKESWKEVQARQAGCTGPIAICLPARSLLLLKGERS